jgi:hypothetical protein
VISAALREPSSANTMSPTGFDCLVVFTVKEASTSG